MNLVPLKVRIGLKQEKKRRSHAYPSFNDIDPELRDHMDWCHFIDQYGGWHYDQVSGHDDHDSESPRGTWLGMLLVPEAFAKAAAEKFPEQVTIIGEPEAEKFYEQRCTCNQPEVHDDVTALQALAAKRALGLNDDAQKALDPDDPTPGRRRNKRKTWEGFKACCGIEIHEKHRKKKRDERVRDNPER